MRLPAVSPAVATRLFRLALGALCLVVVTGAAVRLTSSGLGCSTWPTCHGRQLTPPWAYHSMVEFGNRMVAVVVTVATALATVGAWLRTTRRKDLVLLAAGTFLGVVAQAVLGGLTVIFKLAPGWVMAHFLLSMAVVAVGVVLLARDARPEGVRVARVSRETLLVSRVMVALTALVLGLGTVVTGAGPHSGSTGVGRLPLSARSAAELHSTVVMLLVGVTLATLLLLRPASAPVDVERRSRWLLAAMVAQGAVGYTQYFTGVPAYLVEVHIVGALAVWLAVLGFHASLFTGVPVTTAATVGVIEPSGPAEGLGADGETEPAVLSAT